MRKGRYVRSRWWVAASCLGAFVAMFGALFARDRDAFDAPETVEAVAPAQVTQPASAAPRGVRPGSNTLQTTRNVAPPTPVPSVPSTTTTRPHTRSRAS